MLPAALHLPADLARRPLRALVVLAVLGAGLPALASDDGAARQEERSGNHQGPTLRLAAAAATDPDAHVAFGGAGGGTGSLDLGSVRRRTPLEPRSPLLTAVGESLAVQGAVMGWNRWVGEAPWANVSSRSLARNATTPWGLDDNAYFVNQLGHPYQGTFSYAAARSAGLGFWTSSAFPFALSALWEVAGETERPSLNDQVTTTVAGIVLGEIVFRASDWIRQDGRTAWRAALATLVSPMSTLNRGALASGVPEEAGPLRFRLGAGAVTTLAAPRHDAVGTGTAPAFRVAVTHGVPGSADLSFERPFDHFDAVAVFAPTPDPIVTVRARGLLAATDFGLDERGGGLFGLWLSFDLDSPGARRISTSAVGLGATGRWAVGDGLALEGTAIGSAVVLGAAGVLETPVGADRDYRFGPGAQAVLEARVEVGSRLEAGLALRPYLVVASGAPGGRDAVLNAELSTQVRLFGNHALGATATRFLHEERSADGSVARQAGTQVLVSWLWGAAAPPPGDLVPPS